MTRCEPRGKKGSKQSQICQHQNVKRTAVIPRYIEFPKQVFISNCRGMKDPVKLTSEKVIWTWMRKYHDLYNTEKKIVQKDA